MIELSDREFACIREYVYRVCGITISDNKRYLVRQRLEPLLWGFGMKSYTDLCEKLKQPGSGTFRDAIVSAITTNETFFFRDVHPFDAFEKAVLPEIGKKIREGKVREGGGGTAVKLWCAAASTGQEAYSLAMLTSEYINANAYTGIRSEDFHILASDISTSVLIKAKAGWYTEAELSRGLDCGRRQRYFETAAGGWKLNEPIRRMVEFRVINLLDSFIFLGRFDVIFSRNVLIYFDTATKKKIIEKFRKALNPGGVLFLGAAENIYNLSDGFESVRVGQTVFYRKKGG